MSRFSSCRGGYTLIELLISLGISSLLLSGLATTLLVAGKSADTDAPPTATLKASGIVRDMLNEFLQCENVIACSTTMADFIVGDRDGDGLRDRIRYEWSGAYDRVLTRQVNGRRTVVIAQDVRAFQFTWLTETRHEVIQKSVVSDEVVVLSHSVSGLSRQKKQATTTLNSSQSIGQFIHPDDFAITIPDDADSWNIHGVRIRLASSGKADGRLRIQIRSATSDKTPTSQVLVEKRIEESSLSSSLAWYTCDFDQPIQRLNPASSVCIVCIHESTNDSAQIEFDLDGSGGLVGSSNAGATWDASETAQLAFELIASYVTTESVTQTSPCLTGCKIQFALGDSPVISHGTSMNNRPGWLEKSWVTQFISDPTAQDDDRDGQPDWTIEGRAISGIGQSIWKSGLEKKLLLSNGQNLTTPTTVEATLRQVTLGGDGAILHVDADWQSGTYCPFTIRVKLQDDGTQTLELVTDESSLEKLLLKSTSLPDEMINVRLLIDPDQDLVALAINEMWQGAFNYVLQRQNQARPEFYITNDGGDAEFDFLSIRVSETAP